MQDGTTGSAPANERINLTVRPVTRLAGLLPERDSHGSAQGARPARPAGYARRYAYLTNSQFLSASIGQGLTMTVSVGRS